MCIGQWYLLLSAPNLIWCTTCPYGLYTPGPVHVWGRKKIKKQNTFWDFMEDFWAYCAQVTINSPPDVAQDVAGIRVHTTDCSCSLVTHQDLQVLVYKTAFQLSDPQRLLLLGVILLQVHELFGTSHYWNSLSSYLHAQPVINREVK